MTCFGSDMYAAAVGEIAPPVTSLSFAYAGEQSPSDATGYWFTARIAANDAADSEDALVDFRARAPTKAESWANPPGGNSYFFFSGTVQSKQPVHVQSGTTIDVWFPFVLDPALRYSLTIAAPNAMSLGPIRGALKDNTLRFVLPAFTATPGAELMGEVESN